MIILSVALLQGDGGKPLVCEVVNLAASDYPKCTVVLLQGDGGGPLVCEVVNIAASAYPK